jgi:hypothetical protein
LQTFTAVFTACVLHDLKSHNNHDKGEILTDCRTRKFAGKNCLEEIPGNDGNIKIKALLRPGTVDTATTVGAEDRGFESPSGSVQYVQFSGKRLNTFQIFRSF